MRYTRVTTPDPTDLYHARLLVLSWMCRLPWRHHGAGMIQAYITPSLRIHVWHPDFVLPGMVDSGAIHDHRFDLQSTVVFGSLVNREYSFESYSEWAEGTALVCPRQLYEIYEVECATSGKTDDPVKVSDRPRPVFYREVSVLEGQRYTFPKRAFHMSRPQGDGYVITLVRKFNQEKVRARLLAPQGTRPVHAFKPVENCSPNHHQVVETACPQNPRRCHLSRFEIDAAAIRASHALAERLPPGELAP